MKNCLHLYIIALSFLILSSASYAQNEGRWYQVEVLIFKPTDRSSSDEMWRKDIRLSYPSNVQYIENVLSKNTHHLGGHNYTLRKNGQYTVLFHKAWDQQMWGKEQSPSLIIRGGQSYGKHRELEGSIRIHIGRYLHVTTDLWLSEFFPNASVANDKENDWPLLPALPGRANNFDGAQPSRVVTVREKRRMRSKETHYIDHPLLGILVRMVPIKLSTN